jgi:hypothetical protein
MRAGFIGAWGEWHSSTSGNSCGYNSGTTSCATADVNRAIVRDALVANVPATTQIGIRYPADLMKWYPSPTQQTRLGMHNDCFQSGPSDAGTYQTAEQRTYAKALSLDKAFGGENCTVETPLRTSCSDILSEGPAYRLAWFSYSDWAGFLTAWRNGGCLSQVSGFMGYRLQLDAVSHHTAVTAGGQVVVDVDLRNVGWARMFTSRKLVVTLRHRTTGSTVRASAGDLRVLVPQGTASTRVSVTVPVPAGADKGDYDVLLSAPDAFPATAADPRFAVLFANADNDVSGLDYSRKRKVLTMVTWTGAKSERRHLARDFNPTKSGWDETDPCYGSEAWTPEVESRSAYEEREAEGWNGGYRW